MAITASMDGRLYSMEKKTSKGGREYVTAVLRDSVKDQEGNWTSRFVNIVAFGSDAEYIASQPEGTSLIVDGPFSMEVRKDKDGNFSPRGKIVVSMVRRPETSRVKDGVEPNEVVEDSPVAVAVESENPFN
jgi:single-stranded DNA-binding protein